MSKIACVFPGQGSQSVGMLSDLAQQYSHVQDTYAIASDVLGYDLWNIVQNDGDKLSQTQVTQPALLAASYAIWRIMLENRSNDVAFLAGHSLGEYSALVCAGVLTFEDAIKLVEARGTFMQQAVPAGTGAMYAIIGLDDDKIIAACESAAESTGEITSAVNFNSPGQVVIAGTKVAAEKAAELCKEAGAKRALPLAVSVPSHCELMRPAAEKLEKMLNDMSFSVPNLPVVNNVDVKIESMPENIRSALVRQLYCPVRWTESVSYLAENGVSQLFEVGPGKVLTGLTKRIDKRLTCEAINTLDSLSTN